MREIKLEKRDVDYKEYIKRNARETDFDTLIDSPALCTFNGDPVILYVKLDNKLTHNIRVACRKVKYQTSTRTAGLKTTSRIFGYNPRNTIRKDFCSATSLANEAPTEHAIICNFGSVLAELYEKYFPAVYQTHAATVEEKMLDEWRIPGTPFTSGIVNKNNPLKYHFDAGNISHVLSNMLVLKDGVEGGHLACPEYNIGFEVADNTAILFDGQKILHGVTPIKYKNPNAYRHSIVYYTLKQMWNCLPLTEELARSRQVRAKREKNRAKGKPTI